jgi:hypothetical protein
MPRDLPLVLGAGVVAGTLDLLYALIFFSLRGAKPIRIPQSIASGLLGARAFQGGLRTALLGIALHFLIACSAAAIFYAASRKIRFLTAKPVLSGLLYGAAIYLFMNYVVVPLSAARSAPFSPLIFITGALAILFLVGLPISLIISRYAR